MLEANSLSLKKLKYAIIGCGAAGKVHGFHFSRHPWIQCIAAADVNKENALYFQNNFGFRYIYDNYLEMFKNESLDVVSICTPPKLHAEQIYAAAQKKIHILSEKPLCTNSESAEASVRIAAGNDIKLGVMLPRRFYNNTLATKKGIEKGFIGHIKSIKFQLECKKDKAYYNGWRGKSEIAGGGVLMSQAIHSIDQLVYLFGRPVSVSAQITKTRNYIDVEDEASGIIHFDNNLSAKITATANSKHHQWQGVTEIYGTNGTIILDSHKTVSWDINKHLTPPKPEEQENVPFEFKPFYYGPGHLKVIQNFIASITNHQTLIADASTSLDSLKIILGMYDSSKRNNIVSIPIS